MSTFDNINSLDEICFIGGTEYTIDFNLFDEDGVPIDISSGTVLWVMSYYGQPEVAVVNKDGEITGENSFRVKLLSTDTSNLSGKFVHQPVVIDHDGAEFRPNQGIITIVPAINRSR